MTEPRHLELPLPPSEPLDTFREAWAMGRAYPTEASKSFRRLVQLSCEGFAPLEGALGVRLQIHTPPNGIATPLSCVRAALEHLRGLAFAVNSTIERLDIGILADDEEKPRIDVWLFNLGPPVGKGMPLPPAPEPKKKRAPAKPNTDKKKRGRV